jgi:guanylate kinase
MANSYHDISRRGLMMVFSSPSGAGKSTISKEILRLHEKLSMSISATTRPIRPGESNGKDYIFIDQTEFDQMVLKGELLEYATVFGHSYGTPRSPVETALSQGYDVMFDVDWQGTQQLKQNAREDIVSIFILPPSIQELERRLYARAQDSKLVVKARMGKATSEMSHWAEYDYVIINHKLTESVEQVGSILAAERLRRDRRVGLGEFIRELGVSQ